MSYKIFPLGDDALTIEFGNEISLELNNQVLKLARFFDRKRFEGFIETVPAYSSLTVYYDVFKVRRNFTTFSSAFEAVRHFTRKALENLEELAETQSRLLTIPVCFDSEFALDLEFVASENNLSPEKVIETFLDATYRVFMLGFLPGFSYMGEVDETIATPRKLAPRVKVPAGSVGIAGKQTGIYSLESPGGWQIIGKTPLELFTPAADSPAFLQAGDEVKFYRIDKQTFEKTKAQI
jgi:inhibitor of KinA